MRPNRGLEIDTTLANSNAKTGSQSVYSPISPKKHGVAATISAFFDSLSAHPDSSLRDSSQMLPYYTDDSSSLGSPRSLEGLAAAQSCYSLDSVSSLALSNTSFQQAQVRMTGRGGSGSKPRIVQSQPLYPPTVPSSPISSFQSNSAFPPMSASHLDGKRRFVGRGGCGSQQREIKRKDVEADGPVEEAQKGDPTLSPTREDVGSRPAKGSKLSYPRARDKKTIRQHPTSPSHFQQFSSMLLSPASPVFTRPVSPSPETMPDFDAEIDGFEPGSSPLPPYVRFHRDRQRANFARVERRDEEIPPCPPVCPVDYADSTFDSSPCPDSSYSVVSESGYGADMSSPMACSSVFSSPSSSYGHELPYSSSFGRGVEQGHLEEVDVERVARSGSDHESGLSPAPSRRTFAAIPIPDHSHYELERNQTSNSSAFHSRNPSLASISSTESSRPHAHCGEDAVHPYGETKELKVIASANMGITVVQGQGWIGEWNMQISDVIEALRLL